MVLETAMNGQSDALVTFNVRDFQIAMTRPAPHLLTPSRFLARERLGQRESHVWFMSALGYFSPPLC